MPPVASFPLLSDIQLCGRHDDAEVLVTAAKDSPSPVVAMVTELLCFESLPSPGSSGRTGTNERTLQVVVMATCTQLTGRMLIEGYRRLCMLFTLHIWASHNVLLSLRLIQSNSLAFGGNVVAVPTQLAANPSTARRCRHRWT